MAIRTYGVLKIQSYYVNSRVGNQDFFVIEKAEPHVCIKLKNLFPKIPKTAIVPYKLSANPENAADILWFIERYPLEISAEDLKELNSQRSIYINNINELERISLPDYVPHEVSLNDGEQARNYQLSGSDYFIKACRLLLGDDLGLGKTLTGIISLLKPDMLPAAVVMQAHLPNQWDKEIKRFTNLKVHIIKKGKMYSLPPADIYIFKYTILKGWVDYFASGILKSALFDEIQELRHCDTEKYKASDVLSTSVNKVMGMSATPIYNYGNEIFNVMNIISKGCLGTRAEFIYEWTDGDGKIVQDPKALGSYLREKCLFLRRTREDVGRELPAVNKIVHEIPYDEHEIHDAERLAKQLAIKVVSGTFTERGQASRELDIFMRHTTGVAKAKSVAAYVRIILENGIPIVLAGWHRQVYDIWLEELKEFNPVMYTGSESPYQKEEAVKKFVEGNSKVFILSLRSGIGLDGLQFACNMIVFGELDHSPKVHDQVTARVDRGGQQQQCTAIYLTTDWGSDPVMIERLGIKSSQSHGIVDPLLAVSDQYTDESFIKTLANKILKRNGS